ncbi:kinase-like protein [Panus rudis PR-1116 ss-1]|nr:kinase-like protein [Panus rudis PR-1116 ss-1]
MTAPTIPNFTDKIVDDGRLRLVEILGEGAMGIVYRAVPEGGAGSSSSATKEYAVKVMVKADPDSVLGQCQSREVVAHKIVSGHPNILTLHKVLEDDQFIFLVLDYCPGGDMFKSIAEDFSYCRNDALVKKVFLQILDAIKSCHDKGIFHRDLKPDNVFVSADGQKVFLGDFGLATDNDCCEQFGCGSTYYMSPECIGKEFNYLPYSPAKSDIWALGILLVNMIAGRNPWKIATTDDLHFLRYLAECDYLLKMLPISSAANDLLRRVLNFNPKGRITIEEFIAEVIAIDTFFLSEEALVNANERVRGIAAAYSPRAAPAPAPVVEVQDAGGKGKGTGQPTIDFSDDVYGNPNPGDIWRFVPTGTSSKSITSDEEDITTCSSFTLSTEATTDGSTGPITPEMSSVTGVGIVSDFPMEVDICDIPPVTDKKEPAAVVDAGLVAMLVTAD